MSARAILPFLVGAFCSRVVINEADHLSYGVRAYFPETKAWVAQKLQPHLGGSIFTKQNKLGASVCYTIKSKEDLAKLRQVLLRYYRHLPELAPLMTLFRKKLDLGLKPRLKRNRGKAPPRRQRLPSGSVKTVS